MSDATEYGIVVEHLTKRFGRITAVDDISFRVPCGEIFGFLGLNGAGKTTTLRVLAGLLSASYQRITVAGYDLTTERMQIKSVVGVVPDEPAFYEMLSGRTFLKYVGAMQGLVGKDLTQRVDEVIAQVGLEEEVDRAVLTYSKGMRQRLAFGAAVIHQPRVLLLDEPFVGIDAYQTRELKDDLRDFARGGGTVFMCSHMMEMVENLCTSFIVIDEGRIISTEAMTEFASRHPEMTLEDYLASFGEKHDPSA